MKATKGLQMYPRVAEAALASAEQLMRLEKQKRAAAVARYKALPAHMPTQDVVTLLLEHIEQSNGLNFCDPKDLAKLATLLEQHLQELNT